MADAETLPAEAHVAIVPAPGMGHLIPLVEFAKRLTTTTTTTTTTHLPPPFTAATFSVTLLIPTTTDATTLTPTQSSFLHSLPPSITYTLLPPADLHDLPETTRIETRISLTVTRSLSSIRDALKTLTKTKNLVAVVVDGFGTDVFDVAGEFNAPPYLFFASGATCLAFSLLLPELDEKVTCEYRDMQEPVEIPGSVTLHGRDFFDPVQDRKDDAYRYILHHTRRCTLAEGIILNTFMKLEEDTIRALRRPGYPPVYPIGPLVQMGSSRVLANNDRDETSEDCLKWLDDQAVGSVVYVSFGSGGTLSSQQLEELAMGLEMSEQRFLWVVRSPNEEAANAAYFQQHHHDNNFPFLPKGFLQRIKGRGFLVSNWAPQAQILTHPSTGGFLTHCGWNSTLESLVAGVPLIAWPLFAEQRLNAILLHEVLQVALRPKGSENGLVEKAEIAKVVKSLMEGEEGKRLRSRVRELKEAAQQELSPEGSSTKALLQVASKWLTKIK